MISIICKYNLSNDLINPLRGQDSFKYSLNKAVYHYFDRTFECHPFRNRQRAQRGKKKKKRVFSAVGEEKQGRDKERESRGAKEKRGDGEIKLLFALKTPSSRQSEAL